MRPPEKPGPFDCCGQGCIPCVYEIYAEELKRYEEWRTRQETRDQPDHEQIDREDERPDKNMKGS